MQNNTDRKSFARLGLAVFILFFVPVVLTVIIASIVMRVAPELADNGWYTWLVSYIPLYVIAFPIYLLLLRLIPDTFDNARRGAPNVSQTFTQGTFQQQTADWMMPPGTPLQAPTNWAPPFAPALPQPRKPGIGRMILIILSTVFIAQAINIGLVLLNIVLGMISGYQFINGLSETVSNSMLVANLVFALLIAPCAEEYIFRWTFYKKLAGYGPKVYIFVSAAAFGLFHASFFQTLYAFLIGIVLASLLWYTHKLRYTIIAHMGVNFLSLGVGQTLLQFVGTNATAVYSYSLLFLGFVALIVGVILLISNWKNLGFGPGLLPTPKLSSIIGNFGTIAFVVVVLLLIALSITSYDPNWLNVDM